MIDLHEVETTIEQLRREGGSMRDADRLATLYILRDHMQREEDSGTMSTQAQAYSRAASPVAAAVSAEPKSEFEQACYDVRFDALVSVLNEHMKVVMVVHPKEYKMVIAMLNAAREG